MSPGAYRFLNHKEKYSFFTLSFADAVQSILNKLINNIVKTRRIKIVMIPVVNPRLLTSTFLSI